ncbi:MAG: ribonuclease E/G [Alphaproteobacteria bacterium]|nr:ribonuclease E/G [Alphaproteobacteria bacterium]
MKLYYKNICGQDIVVFVDIDNTPLRIMAQSQNILNVGEIVQGKITHKNNTLKGYFIETDKKLPVFAQTTQKYNIGESVSVKIKKGARLGKDATGIILKNREKNYYPNLNLIISQQIGYPVSADKNNIITAAFIEDALETTHSIAEGAKIRLERTHACWTFDVDSAQSTLPLEKINQKAVDEIARQILLKNISGVILIDFAGPKTEKEQEQLMLLMLQRLFSDKSTEITGFTPARLMELKRTHTAPSLPDIYLTSDGKKGVPLLILEIWERITHFVGGLQTLTVHPTVKPQLPEDFYTYCVIKTNPNLSIDEYTLTGVYGNNAN